MRLRILGALFKGRRSGRIVEGMARPRLLAREAVLLEELADGVGSERLAEAFPADRGEILERVGAEAVPLGIGAGQHDLDEARLLLGRELRRPARPRAVVPARPDLTTPLDEVTVA